MRHERRTSEIVRRSANDVFMEAKRRFQYKPGPSRKPHVHDIVGKTKMDTQNTIQLETETKIEKDQKVEKAIPVKRGKQNHSCQKIVKQERSIHKQQVSKSLKHVLMESKDINFEKPEDFKKNMKEQKFENLSRIEPKVFSQIKSYYQPPLSSKEKNSKGKVQTRNMSMQIKAHKQKENYSRNTFTRQIKPTPYKKTYSSLNSSISMLSKPQSHTAKNLSPNIDFLGVSQPQNQSYRPKKLQNIQISLTELDIQIQNVKQPEQLFPQHEDTQKRYKYDIEQSPSSRHNSALSLSPVKGYSFDKEPQQQTRKKKQSIQLFKSIKQPIIEQQDDKTLDSRVLQTKFTQIFQALDSKQTGILNNNNSCNSISLHPDIKYLIAPIISKIKHENKSFNKKQFYMEIKRIMLSMRDKQVHKIMKCPIYSKLQQRKYSQHSAKTSKQEGKTIPLKQITKQPYMRLNTRNSIGEIQLSKLSLQDSLEKSPLQNAKQFRTDRGKDTNSNPNSMQTWHRAIQSQIEASRIDALNDRLSVYIIKNNIQTNRQSSNQINLDFFQLKKHLGFC